MKKLLNSVKSVAEDEKRIKKQLTSKLSKKQKRLAAAGIDSAFEGVISSPPPTSRTALLLGGEVDGQEIYFHLPLT